MLLASLPTFTLIVDHIFSGAITTFKVSPGLYISGLSKSLKSITESSRFKVSPLAVTLTQVPSSCWISSYLTALYPSLNSPVAALLLPVVFTGTLSSVKEVALLLASSIATPWAVLFTITSASVGLVITSLETP